MNKLSQEFKITCPQSELKEEELKFQQRIQEKQKKVQELKQAVNTIKLSAQTAVDDNLKKRLEEFCEEEFIKIPPHAAAVQIISPSEPQSREEFLKYFCYLTLDPNTTHPHLILSEKNRVRYFQCCCCCCCRRRRLTAHAHCVRCLGNWALVVGEFRSLCGSV
ncbi:hypothetical protein KOW79_005808 [Hemibagrus wyckioides]|uniref:Uncharacterized protein n=1 Tax=Hemibagrus wyckioides TaxID=337641 RepID=A0A9D3P0B8_9TELE|nr:hypothetical protein KOW79_005808 [Hemibagrus wyckioides]